RLGLRLDPDSMVIPEAPQAALAAIFTVIETGHQVVFSWDKDDARNFLKEFATTVAKAFNSGTPLSGTALIGGLLRRPLLLLNVADAQTLSGFFRVELNNNEIGFVDVLAAPQAAVP